MPTPKKKDKQVHMGEHPSNHAWYAGNRYIPFDELSNVHLQRAKMHIQKKLLHYFHVMNKLTEIEEKIDEEAERRKITLDDYDNKLFKNIKHLKNKTKKP